MVKISREFKLVVAIAILSVAFSLIIYGKVNSEALVTTGSVFMGSLYGAALIILYNMDNKYISRFYKYLAVGFSASAMLTISFVMLFKQGFDNYKALAMLGRIFVITSFYQPLTLIFSFKNQKKDIKYLKLINVNIIFVLFSLFICYRINLPLNSINGVKTYLVRNILLVLLSLCYIYAGVLANNEKYNYSLEYKIVLYLNHFISSRVIMILTVLLGIPHIIALRVIFYYSLILIGDYFMVKILISKIIWQPERIIYKDLIDKSNSLKKTIGELTLAKRDIEGVAKRSLIVIDNLPVGVLLITKGKISFANEAFKKMFNIDDKRLLIGKSITDIMLNNEHLDDQTIIMQNISDVNKYILSINNINITCSLHLVKADTLGEDVYIAIIENLSEKINIKKLHDEMEKNKKQENVKDDFLANLSHEFKTPINVIYSAIQMEDLSKRTGNLKDITKYNDIIKKNCYRLIKLINNFIDTTRIEQGTIKTNFKPINIVSLVEDTTMSVILYAENRGLTITFDTDEEEVYVNADNLLIERVVLNLISNAIKYNKENGHIDVIVKSNEHEAAVYVKDNGIGISKEHQSMMFNRYERIDKKLARENEGSGLGLNIVKEIIDLHKGRIEVESEEGVGTSISFILPVVEGSEDYSDFETSSCEINSKFKYTADVEMSDIIE